MGRGKPRLRKAPIACPGSCILGAADPPANAAANTDIEMTKARMQSQPLAKTMPGADAGKKDAVDAGSPVEDTIDYKVGRLRKALDRYSAPIVSELGLTLAEWRVLTHIRAGSSVTASWLCDRLLVDKAEVSRACASLIKRGLVSSKSNPEDARSSLLGLTAAGRASYARILPARLELDRGLASLLTAKEHAALCDVMERLTAEMLRRIADVHERAHEKD